MLKGHDYPRPRHSPKQTSFVKDRLTALELHFDVLHLDTAITFYVDTTNPRALLRRQPILRRSIFVPIRPLPDCPFYAPLPPNDQHRHRDHGERSCRGEHVDSE